MVEERVAKVSLPPASGSPTHDPGARPVALITGASSGIGADLARELGRDGYDLIVTGRRVEPMETLAEEVKPYGASTIVIPADLSEAGAACRLMEELESQGLIIDVLINNAGLGAHGRFDQNDPVRIGEMLQVNIVALTELTRLLLPGMIARRNGRVMLVASTASFQPGPQMAVYFATKAYVLSFGEAIAYELRGTGVTVTSLCPGATITNFSKVADIEKLAILKSPLDIRHDVRGSRANRLPGPQGWPASGRYRLAQQDHDTDRPGAAPIDHPTGRQLDDVQPMSRLVPRGRRASHRCLPGITA